MTPQYKGLVVTLFLLTTGLILVSGIQALNMPEALEVLIKIILCYVLIALEVALIKSIMSKR